MQLKQEWIKIMERKTVSSMRQFGTESYISDGIRIADALGVDVRDLAK